MNNKEKYEHAGFMINRFDHYNDSVNNKGAFYIGLNTFLLGGLCVGFVSLYDKLEKPFYLWVLLIAFALCSIASIILTIIAINPYLASGNELSRNRSLIFFGSIAEYKKDNYMQAFKQQEDERSLDDMITQVWLLSKGLTKKYRRLKWAGFLLIVEFILLAPIIFCITKMLLDK